MMRRVSLTSTALVGHQVAGISAFNFGQPDLSTEFIPSTIGTDVPATIDEKPKVTEMPNGARVITHDKAGAQTSLGFYVRAGPKYDPSNKPGLSYVMRWALPTSNMENSLFQIDRNVRAFGNSSSHTEVRKEWLGFKLEGRRDGWQKSFEDLATCISAPRFPTWDTERFRDTMDNILEEQRWTNPREYAIDQLETKAFFKEPVGSPRTVPPYANNICTHKALLDQWCGLCIPKNVVVAGVNIEHEELIAAYQNSPYPHSASAPHHAKAAGGALLPAKTEFNQYTSGEFHEIENREEAKGGSFDGIENTIITALGYAINAGRGNTTSYATSLVVSELVAMALEDSLKAGNYREQLAHSRGVQPFLRSFDGASLVGITSHADVADAGKEVAEGQKVLTKGVSFTAENLTYAKNRAATSFYHNEIEYGRDYLDFLGTSISATSNSHVVAEEYLKAINSVTLDSVKAMHTQATTTSRPTLFATGKTAALPSMRQMGF